MLCLGFDRSEKYPADDAGRRALVDSVCEYCYRIRPLFEWTAFKRREGRHHDTKEFLLSHFDTFANFRMEFAALVACCEPVKKRIVLGTRKLDEWLSSGVSAMAIHRAQFLPLGLSAIMHRILSPSPGRDCLLFVIARGCV